MSFSRAVRAVLSRAAPLKRVQVSSLSVHASSSSGGAAAALGPWDELGIQDVLKRGSSKREPPPLALPPLSAEEERELATKAAQAFMAGDFDEAADKLRRGRVRSRGPLSGPWTEAISTRLKAIQSDRALELLDILKTVEVLPDRRIYTSAIRACGHDGENGAARALELLREMRDAGGDLAPDAPVFAAAIAVLHTTGHADETLQALRCMQAWGIRPSQPCYIGAMQAAARKRDAALALSLLDEWAQVSGHRRLDHKVFSAALSACRSSGDKERALHILDMMRGQGVAPNPICLGEVVNTYLTAGDARGAAALLMKWAKGSAASGGAAAAPDREAAAPEAVAATVAAPEGEGNDAAAPSPRAAHPGGAQRRREGLRRHVFNEVLAALAAARDAEGAQALLEVMRKHEPQPNDVSYAHVARAAARSAATADRAGSSGANGAGADAAVAAAAAVLESMAKEGVEMTPAAYRPLLAALAVAGDAAGAVAALEAARAAGVEPNNAMYNTAVQAAVHAQDAKTAMGILEDMERRDVKPPAFAVRALVYMFLTAKDVKGAVDTLTRWRLPRAPPTSLYHAVLHACEKARNAKLVATVMRAHRAHEKRYRIARSNKRFKRLVADDGRPTVNL